MNNDYEHLKPFVNFSFNPLLDFNNLNDEQIYEKLAELNMKKYQSFFYRMSFDVQQQINDHIHILTNILRERQRKILYNSVKDRLEKTINSDEKTPVEKPKRKILPII